MIQVCTQRDAIDLKRLFAPVIILSSPFRLRAVMGYKQWIVVIHVERVSCVWPMDDQPSLLADSISTYVDLRLEDPAKCNT